jgi:hypothetical protein
VLFAVGAPAGAAELEIVATHPGVEARLGLYQRFYVAVDYALEPSEPAIQLEVEAFADGERVRTGTNGLPDYEGSGRGLVWFFLSNPGDRVDTVRIRAVEIGTWQEKAVLELPVSLRGDPAARRPAELPPWVVQLRAEQKRQLEAAWEASHGDLREQVPLVAAGLWVMLAITLAGWLGPIVAACRWRGAWRAAAVVLAVLVNLPILGGIAGMLIDPRSHNLWPLEFALYAAPAALVLALMALARRMVRAPTAG